MPNDSIELGRIRAKVLDLEDKTEKLTIVNSTASFDQTVSITGNLYVNGELLDVSIYDLTSALAPYLTIVSASSLYSTPAQITASYPTRLETTNALGNYVLTSTANATYVTPSQITASFGLKTDISSSFVAKADLTSSTAFDNRYSTPAQITASFGLKTDISSSFVRKADLTGSTAFDNRYSTPAQITASYPTRVEVTGTINILTSSLSSSYARLAAINTFSANQIITGTLNASSNISGNANLIIGGNIGVGISPSDKLHIYNTNNANNGIIVDTSNAGYQTYLSLAATGSTAWQFGRQGSGSNNQLFLYDGAGARDVIRANPGASGDLLLQPVNGDVGIGVTSALEKLHVVGNAIIGTTFNSVNGYPSSDLIVHVSDATSALGQENAISIFRQQSADSWPQIATMTIGRYETGTTEARTRLDFNLKHANVGTDTAEVNVMSLNSAGRVGVGTASPARQLSVVGQFSVVSGAVGEDTAYNGTIISTKTGSSNQHINIIRAGNHVRSIGYVPNSNTFLIAGGEATDSNFGNNIPFSIDSSGRVGIGTTSPSTKLTVVDNGYPSVLISSSYAASSKVYSSIQFGASNTNGGGDIGFVHDQTTPANSFFHITPYGAVQGTGFSLGSDGNSGFGVANPFNKIHIDTTVANDGIYLNGNSSLWTSLRTNLGAGAYNSITNANDRGIIYGGASDGSPGGGFVIAPWATGPSGLRINENGNVGIGITSPAVTLEVSGTIKSGRISTTEGGELQLARGFDNAVKWTIDAFGSGDSSAFRIFDNTGSVAFYINPTNRYVGLGGSVSSIPTVPLHVKNGNSTYTDPENNNLPTIFASNTSNASTNAHAILGTRVGGASGGDPFISFDISGVTGWSIGVDNSDSDKFKISNAWNDVGTSTDLTIQTNGSVGIGTTSPNTRLHVLNNGSAFSLEGTDHVYMQWYPDGTASGRKAYTGFPGSTADYFIIANEIATNGDIILQPGSNADVGINTTTPAADLDINNGSLGTTSGNTLEALRLTSTVSNGSFLRFFLRRHANGSDWNTAATRIQQQIDGVTQGFIEFNHPSNKGGVVIGTDGGVYPLYVNGSYSISATYGYLNSSGLVGTATANTPISIRASDRIMATEFNAVSDARNKEIYSDVEVNLKEKFKQLNITNFIQKSDLGIKKNKGVIAQEVEKIFPDAVSQTTDYVYDIFCLCEKVIKLNEQDYEITSTKIVDLKIGDEIKIFYKDLIDNINKEKYLLVKNIIDFKTFIVDSGEDITNECVIVGRKVDDFRIVNYQYLNSVTAKMVQELIVENDYLKNKLEEKENQINNILARLSALENK